MKSGLADITLESRKELKETIIKLANIILKKEELNTTNAEEDENQKILKRLLQLHPKSIDLSLNRIKRLLKDLNNPEKKITNAIQVVGTNGKHSVCSTLREIFETANYTVNLNISPSLRKFNERYYFSGKYISDDQLV